MSTLREARFISIGIRRDWRAVYDFLAEPLHFNDWAAGLGHSLHLENGCYVGQGPAGPISIRFSPRNDLGVADHWVTVAPGVEVDVPLRVIPDGAGSLVALTLFRQPGMDEASLAADAAAVEDDLAALKKLLESEHAG
jgi:hypothetical protein